MRSGPSPSVIPSAVEGSALAVLGVTIRTSLLVVVITAALAAPGSAILSQAPPEQNRFARTVLADGLDEPMQLEFDRAGRVYFIERKGALKRYDESTGQLSVLGRLPVAVVGEAGLIGLLLDHDFERTRHVYLYFSPARDSGQVHLSRFTLTSLDSIDVTSEVIVMRWPFEVTSHMGGGMTWDAQGNLYLTTGDNSAATQFNPVHWTAEGGKAQDAQRTSANSNDLRGKILRIHPEPDGTYTVPAGNLFPPGTPKARAEIYTMGNRNPWRVTIDAKTGFLHWGEIGPDAGSDSAGIGPRGYDELNVAMSAGNYGWPFFIGYNRGYNTVDYGPPKSFGPPMDPAHPVNHSPNNTGMLDLPPARPSLLAYPYGVSEEWPVLGSGGRCAVGGPIFRASSFHGARRFPDYYEGKWFVVDYVRTWIMVATMNDDRTKVVSMERFLPDEKYTSPLDMDFGPNGDLYVIEYSPAPGGRLSKISYTAGNRAPRIVASASRVAGATPLKVSLSSRGTTDPDGDMLRYQWSVTPSVGTGRRYAGANPVVTLATPGVYQAVLTATDSHGASSRDSIRLVAGNEPPRVALDITRGNRSFYFANERVAYRARVTDREDGRVSANRTTVTADYVPSGMTPAEVEAARNLDPDVSMAHLRAQAIIARSDCVACHRTEARLVGPAFREVAARYAGQDVLEKIAQKIITGGKGAWGEIVMPPHPALTSADASVLARYILSLSNPAARPQPLSSAGVFTTAEHRIPTTWNPAKTVTERGSYVLRVSYTDKGANGVAPLTSNAAVLLRHPLLAPESADSISAGITYNLSRGDPGFVIRRSRAHIAFKALDLNGIGSIEIGALTRFYTWSHFKGATVEVRLDSVSGALAGAPVAIVPPRTTTDRVILGDKLEKPVSVALSGSGGIHDVYFVFTNRDARPDDDLLLLTGVEFKPAVTTGAIPAGFAPLFNGRDLTGWHVSRTTHHGTTPDVRVENGAIVLRQHPYGQGGLLMTNRRFRNFELYLETRPDSGTNGGIFFRSSEGGSAYQVELEGGGSGGTGNLFGEMMRVSTPVRAVGVQALWKQDDWNSFRIRVNGDAPRVALWINGVQLYDAQLGRNDLIGWRTDGMIALQGHWTSTYGGVSDAYDMSGSWKPGAAHRFRNIAIRELGQ